MKPYKFNDKIHAQQYEIFHENSKLNDVNYTELSERIQDFYKNRYLTKAILESYKIYPYCKRIKLVTTKINGSFLDVIQERRSVRDFINYDVSLNEISNVLFYSYGISQSKEFISNGEKLVHNLRFVPSAGGLYPLDVYLILFNSRDLEPGVYHYNVIDNCIELVIESDLRNKVIENLPNQYSLETASGVIAITSTFSKNTIKYGERGYRFVLLDAGHLMQNINLLLTSIGLSSYVAGGFYDCGFDSLLKIDGNTESTVYCSPFGKSSKLTSVSDGLSD